MNHCVLYFESQMDQQRLPRPKKPIIADDEIMELLWQNGQVVIQRPNHCHVKKPPPGKNSDDSIRGGGTSSAREVENYNQYLFVQENEMASWLHYDDSPFNQTFSADSLNTLSATVNNNTTMQTPTSVVPSRPPVPPPRRMEHVQPRTPNFAYFAKHGVRTEPGPSSILNTATRESTVVDSCDTPAVMPAAVSEGDTEVAVVSTTFDEPGGSSSSEEAEPVRKVDEHDRKRKGIETEEWEYQSEDVDFESAEAKKNISGSSTKRSRAAEVHNLSERRRRDRINEKMKALQELIPRSNKSDKASMLDEAIDYLKSLQLQVQRVQLMQMMSMGCGMVPMMFPGIQQYMPTVGMGMGMEMGINRPVMPFPNMLSGFALPAAANLGPRFAMPPFHMPHVPTPGSSRTQAANQVDNNVISSAGTHDSNQSRIPNFNDPYQQYLGPHQMQFQLMQNQAMNQPNVSRPLEKPETRQSGDK